MNTQHDPDHDAPSPALPAEAAIRHKCDRARKRTVPLQSGTLTIRSYSAVEAHPLK